jgi:hypothetical protein
LAISIPWIGRPCQDLSGSVTGRMKLGWRSASRFISVW